MTWVMRFGRWLRLLSSGMLEVVGLGTEALKVLFKKADEVVKELLGQKEGDAPVSAPAPATWVGRSGNVLSLFAEAALELIGLFTSLGSVVSRKLDEVVDALQLQPTTGGPPDIPAPTPT